MATISERYDSREATEGIESPSVDLIYTVEGTEDDAEVRALVEATAPAIYAGLLLQTYHINHEGGGVWEASVRYGQHEPKETGESSFSFDTGGVTAHITQSLSTVARYAPSGTAPDCQGAIGVTSDSVEGTDITVPVYNFSETHYLADSAVTGAYKAALFYLTGKVNSAPFKGFAASPNVTGLSVGPIIGIDKKGWEYLWVRYADAEDQNVLVKQPIAAYVEQVYELGNFASLGIGV